MQSIQTAINKKSKNLIRTCLLATLFYGCSPATQDIYADTLGIAPDMDNSTPESSEHVATAVNELSIQDPTARASLRREEVVPQEEKKKIVPVTSPKAANTTKATSTDLTAAPKKISNLPAAPVKLNQLYFDNHDKHFYEDAPASKAPRLTKASYSPTDNRQLIQPLTSGKTFETSKIDEIISRANLQATGGEVPDFFYPIALISLGLVVGIASFGYSYELKRIRAAEKNALANRNLWTKGLTEIIPRRD